MNLRDLRYLVALAEWKHFGKAAEACFVSQPTLSTQIRKLEEQLDVQLVERAPRQVMLTAVGARVAARAQAILREVEAIRDLAREARAPDSGELRLGAFPTLGPYWLPHVVPILRRRFPKLRLYLTEERTDVLLAQLLGGELDAAVLAEPVTEEQLASTPLFEERFVLATARGHPLASLPTVRASDLSGQSLLLLEDGHCLRAQALSICALAGADEVPGFRATSLETLRQMVAADMGITLLPALAVLPPVPRHRDLVVRPFADPAPSRRLSLFWRRSSARGEFLARLASALQPPPTSLDLSRLPDGDLADPALGE